MAVNLTPPSRLTGTAEQQLNGLYSYLYQLVEALNVNMGNSTGAGGGTALYTGAQAGGLVSASGSGIDLDKASKTYQDLKALIIKTATEVTSNIRKVVTEISHEYIAQSEFGTYEEYLLNKITQGADGVLMEWNMVNGITTSVAEFNQYIAESDVYIQVGIVKYNDDGTVEAGVVIGKNLTKVTIDGKELITSQNLYALFTAEELSFWQNGECRARYGMVEFMVEKGYIDEVTTSLLQSSTFGAQLVLREDVLAAIAANINLVANESISLIVGGSENTLRGEIGAAKDELQASIDAVDNKIKDIQLGEIPELDELEAIVEQLKQDTDGEIEDLNTRLDLVPGQITAEVSKTEAKLTTLEEKVDDNQTTTTAEISNLQSQINLIPGQITAEVSKTDAKITTLENKVDGNQQTTTAELNRLQSEIDLVPGKISLSASETKALITTLETKVNDNDERVSGEIADLEDKVDANDSKVTTELTNLQSQIDLVPGKITIATNETKTLITQLESKVDENDGKNADDIAALEGKVNDNDAKVSQQITSLQSQLNLVPGQITAEVSKTETRIDGLEGEIDKHGTDISQMRSEIDMLPDQIRLTVESTPAKELRTGTTVTITDAMFHVNSPETKFSIPSPDSEDGKEIVSIDDEGLRTTVLNADEIHSDSVVGASEPADYAPATAGDLQVILVEISGKWMTGDINIDASALTEGSVEIKGLHGYGKLTISGGTLNAVSVKDCSCIVVINGTKLSITGVAATVDNAQLHLKSVLFDASIGAEARNGAKLLLDSCTGGTSVIMNIYDISVAKLMKSKPSGNLGTIEGELYSYASFDSGSSGGGGSGSGGGIFVPTGSSVSSATIKASKTRTWGGGWLSTGTFGAALYQGATGGGTLRRGCMWFDLSSLSGKTVVSATLTLKRYSGIGGGGSVIIGLYGTSATTDSGTPAVGSKIGELSLANGASGVIDVTNAVKSMISGTLGGLMVYDSRTAVFDGKNYTYGYAKLYGTDTSSAPSLAIKYK